MNFVTNILKVNLMLNCCLLIQSLVYEIKTKDVYEDFKTKNLFDFSDYPLDSKFFDPVNKKLLAK